MQANTAAYAQARRLFFQSNMSRDQIARATGVNVRTIFDWVSKGDWLRAKDMVLNAPTFLSEQYYAQLTALNKKIAARTDAPYPTKDESEVMRRITTTLKAVKAKHTRSELFDVLHDFNAFANDHSPELAEQLTDVLAAYFDQLSGDGPAARLARIQTPKQTAEAYQAHIKDMLDYDNPEPETDTQTAPFTPAQQNVMQVAAGIKEPHNLPDFSSPTFTRPLSPQNPPYPCYGVDWVDHLAQLGVTLADLVKLTSSYRVPTWLENIRFSDSFRIAAEVRDRLIFPEQFIYWIGPKKAPQPLIDIEPLYTAYNSPLPHDPASPSQPIDYQPQHDPIE